MEVFNESNVTDECVPEHSSLLSIPLLSINPNDSSIIGERLLSENYTLRTLPEVVAGLNNSHAYFSAAFDQDTTDEVQEEAHLNDSYSLLIVVSLLFLTIITIWVFQSRRIRILHSTGLALLYGEESVLSLIHTCIFLYSFM